MTYQVDVFLIFYQLALYQLSKFFLELISLLLKKSLLKFWRELTGQLLMRPVKTYAPLLGTIPIPDCLEKFVKSRALLL